MNLGILPLFSPPFYTSSRLRRLLFCQKSPKSSPSIHYIPCRNIAKSRKYDNYSYKTARRKSRIFGWLSENMALQAFAGKSPLPKYDWNFAQKTQLSDLCCQETLSGYSGRAHSGIARRTNHHNGDSRRARGHCDGRRE